MSEGSHKFVICINQTVPAWFSVVEMAVYNDTNGGTWSVVDGTYVLTLGGNHTAGALRFSNRVDYFLVAIGNQFGTTWTGIATDLAPVDTVLGVLPTYYNDGVRDNPQSWHHGDFSAVDKEGRSLSIILSPAAQTVTANLFIAPGTSA